MSRSLGSESSFRGHAIYHDENHNHWYYSDTGELADKPRPCKKCGKLFSEGEPDACLGKLPGVKQACCGHGIRNDAYIIFENGITIRGFVVEKT